jgi:lipopolysaccharide transport protein LptA
MKKIFLLLISVISVNFLLINITYSQKNNIKKEEKKDNKLKIYCDELRYDKKTKTGIAKGHVKIIQDNITIYTSEALYKEDEKITYIDKFVRIIHLDKEENQRKTDISANKMIVYHKDKKVYLENKVRFDREENTKLKKQEKATNKQKIEYSVKKSRSVITADKVNYWTSTGDAIFTGNSIFLQKEKKASADTISIKNDKDKNTDTIIFDNKANLIQIKGDWLVEEKIIDPKEDIENERFVKEKIDIKADKIIIYQKTNNAVGNGNVKIIQTVSNKQREGIGDKFVYDDNKQSFTLTGNVKIKRENEDWLTAEKAIFYINSENFEAFAKEDKNKIEKPVEAEFLIPDENNKEENLPINTPEKDFDLDEGNPLKKDNKNMPSPNNSPKPKPSNSSIPKKN